MGNHTTNRMDDASIAAFASLDLPDRQSVVIRAFAGGDALTDRDVRRHQRPARANRLAVGGSAA